AISVPSFCAKNVRASIPCAASAPSSAPATSRATPTRAPFSTVAFSRSSSPTEPISWLSERWTSSPSSSRAISAASSSCRSETGAKTLEIATPSTVPATLARKRRVSSASNGTRSRPSNSMPPRTIVSPPETASRRSAGQPKSGRTPSVAGAPMRSTATRLSFRRSSTAFVACVVPSITCVIRSFATASPARIASITWRMPPVTSAVVGTLARASIAPSLSSTTASVFVPPTSMPKRKSSPRTQLLHGDVRVVVAERARAGQLQTAGRAPDRIARIRDHRDALPVAQPLGRDRLRRLDVEHRDQVGDDRAQLGALERDEVLVLDLEHERAARVLAESLDRRGAADEAARRPALDVDDLAADQHRGVEL